MKIQTGMKCKQIKAIEKFAFDFVGMEFEIVKVNDNIIMGEGNNIRFGIEPREFENYFELIREEVENNIKETKQEDVKGHAKLGDIVELSNGLKMEICIDEKYPRYYRTVDISTKENVTTIISEHSLKTYCIGNRVWGYGSDEFAIVNIKSEEIKETKNDKRKSEVKQKPSNQVYTYEMIPHKINWKITHNGEIINQTIDSGTKSYKLITNGNITIVILDDGCKGIAKCLPSDEYDLDKGVDIAYTKAMIKSYQKKLKGLVK